MQEINIVNLLIKHPVENKILAVKRSVNDNLYGGMWALPGGGIEPGESEKDAAKRELMEETGLVLDNVQNDPFVVSPLIVEGRLFFIGIYLATVKDGTLEPQDSDISKVEYIELNTLIDSLKENKYPLDQIELLEKAFTKFLSSSLFL